MRTEVRTEKRGDLFACIVKGRHEGKRATERAENVKPADVSSTIVALLAAVEERLRPKEV